ncbi:MAG: hypothetical protein OXU20_10885 [Myxococcales bacterium]|nr:hypothetical protein [Myxococcales bacterium]MDD9971860.1 hypothetical protein [Myxococcales bacterium]
MLQELLAALGGAPTLRQAAEDFREMTAGARDMVVTASALFWSPEPDPAALEALEKQDERLNELERIIHRRALAHLSGSEPADVPYCLLIVSLVKDVERVGDHARNLAAIATLVGRSSASLPDDELVHELRGFSRDVDELARAAPQAYEGDDPERAKGLVEAGRARAKAFDALLTRVAASPYDAATATQLTLAIRFLKRIQGHFMNLLSSMLVPLDRLDQFDEPEPIET